MIEALRHTLCRVRLGDPHDDGHANRFRLGRMLRDLGLCVYP
jgi:hypothetical protein